MKLSDLAPEDWVTRLERRRQLQIQSMRSWWQYYDGEQPLVYVAKIIAEQQDRFPPLTLNWCGDFADMLNRRCKIEGFRVRGNDQLDDQLWELWQANSLDARQGENNLATLVTGLGATMTAPDRATGLPRVTIEAPHTVAVEIDPYDGRVVAAWKAWRSDPEQAIEDLGELWLPGRRIDFEYGRPVDSASTTRWTAGVDVQQDSPAVPITPFMNARRDWMGRSELRALRPIVDAANQTATNMMAAVEHHAVPRKWALGVSEDNFKDRDGNPIPAWKIATGAIWANPYDPENEKADPKVGQFAASDLRNFHDTLGTLARMAAGVCDVHPSAFGFGIADNPPSADSIRASQDDFIARVQGIHLGLGEGYERTMRLAAAIWGEDPAAMSRLEAVWRNPATPTQEAQSRAATANFGSGLSDLRQAREDAGYTKTQIDDMEKREAQGDRQVGAAMDRLDAEREAAARAAAAAGARTPAA